MPDLRERIDELATRLVLGGVSSDLAADLARLSEMAGGTGCPETARVAAELAKKTRAGAKGKKKAAFEDLVRDGIAQLQQVLENEARQTASPVREPGQGEPKPLPVNSLAQDPELVGDFILESREHLASIESRMLVLEQNPADMEAIHSVFRGFHTIKGLAGFLEFPIIQEVAHEVETLLDLARNSKLAITPAVVDAVLASADCLKQAIDAVEASMAGKTPAAIGDYRHLLSRMRELMAGEPEERECRALEPALTEPSQVPASKEGKPGASPAAPRQPAGANTPGKAADTFSVRVDTGKLDYLMDMVGEMVIAQSLVRNNSNLVSIQDPRLQGDLSQLVRITGEVQRTTMSMRMLPIGQLFQRTARFVRDLSRKAEKRVELETSGGDTELDKTIAEELADPLMHMVRNAIDHGVEPPDVRAAAGKNPTARVRLAAYRQGGQIVVEISDDGRGLDREKILKKAREKGLIEDGAQLSENEICRLIFEPGFSTADRVTEVSGRGVGMDVVRKHVQKLRGRIDVQSKAGQGATFFLRLPLTLAIIEGLVVVVGSTRYIVPILSVREMFRPTAEALSTIQGRDEMALVRGRLLPVVRLYRRLGVRPRSEDPCDGLLVVAEWEGGQFCVLVDDLVGKQEVVIKSLGASLKNIAGIAGGAILGDGRVGLILDMEGVFRGPSRD
ncbi:MAG: chemotaxis protein CheA [Bryobacteraceae bacterium]|jgi:two-component system chemotaxis sensor kinase CheA